MLSGLPTGAQNSNKESVSHAIQEIIDNKDLIAMGFYGDQTQLFKIITDKKTKQQKRKTSIHVEGKSHKMFTFPAISTQKASEKKQYRDSQQWYINSKPLQNLTKIRGKYVL